ncbi:hypothetical protein C0992_001001, partial [Termitomyces sp. T32_za158]
MGEGKSAVIIPMVSSALANGERLVRVVVLKSLAGQMFDLLVQRLSGLANHRIFYLPFSRDFEPVPMHLKSLQSLYEMCVQERGILLVQPEHILSFRLMGIDLAAGTDTAARWRVDYGLDLSRTLLAVPYRAKDLPSLRADFGHPDVVLLLTCLSYYYGGLTEEQLNQSFELLFKLDDPPLEYNQWVCGHEEIPMSFRDIKGINLDDEQQKSIRQPLFQNNKAVIDFFLSNVVFPRYAKQFPKKLSTSSWDLAEKKVQVTTGFSGTNDNKYLLPTSIHQDEVAAISEDDPFAQLATNAKVLSILLQPENEAYCCLKGEDGQSPTGNDFLSYLVKSTPPVRVLLDVGAQMLDMQNSELASKWLTLDSALHAIVYFNDDDQLVVMSQKDRQVEKFVTSPFSQKLDLCAVYLDDAHTRGTDLKLPINFRAAVTLGPRLTKDRLVQ